MQVQIYCNEQHKTAMIGRVLQKKQKFQLFSKALTIMELLVTFLVYSFTEMILKHLTFIIKTGKEEEKERGREEGREGRDLRALI